MRTLVVATCSLNQWALDFTGNVRRIRSSIECAKGKGAVYRLGPELEITGYGCEDHFLEMDTYDHAWEAFCEVIAGGLTDGCLCDIGMPIMHDNVPYNCRVLVIDGQIKLIRPKMALANDGNYRERRWFQAWEVGRELTEHQLPACVTEATGQRTVPFGDGAVQFDDTVVGCESCEELFAPQSPHISHYLAGVEIIGNGSGSHHQLRKLHKRVELIKMATEKCGGVYLYANQQGCDGGRLYYDGTALIFQNGVCLAQGSQFSMSDVEVVTACVDVAAVRSFRCSLNARSQQAAEARPAPRIAVPMRLLLSGADRHLHSASPAIDVRYNRPEEEIAYGPACWLWDYLRRSRLSGFFLPLSGGADSASTLAIVGSMCQLVVRDIKRDRERGAAADTPGRALADVRAVTGDSAYTPTDARDLASRIMFTCYMGTTNSSAATRELARAVAGEVGAHHVDATVDPIVKGLYDTFCAHTGKEPRFRAQGGSPVENLALQNIQARGRMAFSYMLAQLLLWTQGRSGSLLVLGSGNVDEALRGYLTKYDCSSADINPIGGISKVDLRRFLLWAAEHLGYATLAAIAAAPPTAELEPITDDYAQTDEADMGMTYDELSRYGHLRSHDRCGPLSMYERLLDEWGPDSERALPAAEVARKVKHFFRTYSINRHKMTTLTPSYHAENYSPEDNRFDLRPFLYDSTWSWQFAKIDESVAAYEAAHSTKKRRRAK